MTACYLGPMNSDFFINKGVARDEHARDLWSSSQALAALSNIRPCMREGSLLRYMFSPPKGNMTFGHLAAT